MNRVRTGATVTWTSHARGRLKIKQGKVLAFVPAHVDINAIKSESESLRHGCALPFRGVGTWRCKANLVSGHDRYLVEVVTETDERFLYAPYASAVEQQNPGAERDGEDALEVSFDPGRGEISTNQVKRVRTPEELFEHAGLDPSEWAIAPNGLTINSYEMNAGGGDVLPLFQIKMRISPVREGKLVTERKAQLLAEIREEATGAYPPLLGGATFPSGSDAKLVGEVCLFDAHFGSLVWGRESGEPYDLEIAEETYRQAFEYLVQRIAAHAPSRILFPIGQDLFHTDILIGGKGGATQRGTPQDVDSRWQKAFMVARRLLSRLVLDTVAQIAPVDIVVVPGNHDTQKSWYLGEVIDAAFTNHAHVRVDNRPVQRKYYRFGRNLLGYTHGHNEKHGDLAMLMAQEARTDWGDTSFREWHMGHLHKEWVDEKFGVRSRIMPALCPADSWHTENGFVQNTRGARGYLWRESGGIDAIFPYELPPSAEHLARIGPMLRA